MAAQFPRGVATRLEGFDKIHPGTAATRGSIERWGHKETVRHFIHDHPALRGDAVPRAGIQIASDVGEVVADGKLRRDFPGEPLAEPIERVRGALVGFVLRLDDGPSVEIVATETDL